MLKQQNQSEILQNFSQTIFLEMTQLSSHFTFNFPHIEHT